MITDPPYVILMSSLPPLGDLFGQQETPITELQLRHRLKYLSEADNKSLQQIEQLVRRSKQPRDWSDEQIVHYAKALLKNLREKSLRQAVEFVISLRTILSALRRRRLGQASPPAQGDWGYGPWLSRLERHWGEPDFSLGAAVPWLPEARKLWDDDDSVGMERLILSESWKQFGRLSHGHYFDFPAVVLYVLRWSLINRRVNYDREIAQKRFNTLIDHAIGNFDQLFTEKAA